MTMNAKQERCACDGELDKGASVSDIIERIRHSPERCTRNAGDLGTTTVVAPVSTQERCKVCELPVDVDTALHVGDGYVHGPCDRVSVEAQPLTEDEIAELRSEAPAGLAAITTATIMRLLATLAAESAARQEAERHVQEQIDDKHRILREYDARLKEAERQRDEAIREDRRKWLEHILQGRSLQEIVERAKVLLEQETER